MTRQEATHFLREKLNEHGLSHWSVRLNQNADSKFLGMCSHKDECIIMSAHHIDIHPKEDVENTMLHEIAHALVGPGHGHDEVWAAKAKEIGCDNTMPCSTLSLSPDIIDAIRSGADVEVTFDEHVIRTPRYTVTRLQDKCDDCGKVAKSVWEMTEIVESDFCPDVKVTELECGHFTVKSIPKGIPFHLMQFGGDVNCKHVWEKNTCVLCDRKKPYDYQLEGMRRAQVSLATGNGVGIFDEMGLGKTIQAQGLVKFMEELQPVLWIVKSGLKYQFACSILRWMGNDHVPQIVNTSKDWLIPGLRNYIIGYDMLVPKTKTSKKTGKTITSGFDISLFDEVGIKCVVLDECQQIKNVDSSRTQMVRRVVKGRKVIALSGTPWKNRGSELFPVLNMMNPTKFNSEAEFKRRWVDTFWQGKFQKEGGIRNIPAFKEFTKDLIIRRERVEVMPELPLVNRTKLNVKMSLLEEQIYDEAVDQFVEWFEEQQGQITGMAIIAAMQKMRHLVALAKIPATMEYLSEFVEDTDRKIVVFAHHKDVQAILYNDCLKEFGDEMVILQLTSEMNGQQRFEAQETFNKSPRAIMIASQLAAGEGLNLQTCSDCVMHERQWNPGNEEQCEGRFIRIGQMATTVNAVYAHMDGLTTIDPKLDEIVEGKRRRFHISMNNSEMQGWNETEIMMELAESIVSAHRSKRNRK